MNKIYFLTKKKLDEMIFLSSLTLLLTQIDMKKAATTWDAKNFIYKCRLFNYFPSSESLRETRSTNYGIEKEVELMGKKVE
jgi:hypothetical protein